MFPAMSDEAIIVRKERAPIFLGGPPLVAAATGQIVTCRRPRRRLRALPSSPVLSTIMPKDDRHALELARRAIANLGPADIHLRISQSLQPSRYRVEELRGWHLRRAPAL